ncbi:LbtU family siderophore porin [Legionella micdadei]|uniref:Coiled-coil protein n=1 Tax=Legionella micdadei TaxID=451 RepID=A0A098GBS7_LEGMI|nr:LbtU family siderophore porin [Legionella micdadei]ARG98380.1 hypothetical protein B6N58_12295 [Legionella micdadei]ARH01130.1 hypothetical protein B6V88_12300 [Legionella micdadei]KTD27315.1 coiled-coil protein [Legionella micdadei]NSL18699.1 LbtU family siderophore porin [Legionella micdadei]CEG59944.1 exported protein of unknown function [coiled-coil domain] [Legionella micdadei]
MIKEKRDILQPILQLVFAITILFISFVQNAFAETLSAAEIRALLDETRALRKEVAQLKKELAEHKREHKFKPAATSTKSKQQIPQEKQAKAQKLPLKKPIVVSAAKETVNIKNGDQRTSKKALNKKAANQSSSPNIKDYVRRLGGYFPTINPYLGQPAAYDGSDLITNFSQQNTDLLALQYRQELENTFSKQDMSNYYLVLSGTLSAQADWLTPYIGRSNSDIDLTVANITGLAGIGKWVTGFFSFDYDNIALEDLTPPRFGSRVGNSRVYVDQGFITVGNLNKFDWYASIGQMYLPFGQYNSYMINSPLTASLFTTSQRPVLFGYSHSTDTMEFDATVYGYRGDTVTSPHSNAINEWGASVDYLINKDNWSTEIGLGYIANIADAQGILLNGQLSQGCTLFGGFAFPCRTQNVLVHKVPGFDIYGNLTIGRYSLIAEYLTATRRFSPIDMTFDGRGAKPKAFDLEGAYAFRLFDKPSSIALGYGFTKQSLALLLPTRQYTITFTTSLWRNTTQSLGFQHDVNYNIFSTATGQLLPVYLPIDRLNLGRKSNTVLFAVNAYF